MGRCNDNQLLPATATAGLNLTAISRVCEAWQSAKLMLRGPSIIDIEGAAGVGVWTFAADAATTAQWVAGLYAYSLRVVDADGTREVANGKIEILPDFASLPAGFDARSPNQVALDAINAVLAKRATLDQQRYTIGDRELWRTPMADLLKLKGFYNAAVRRENANGKFGRAIAVRFHS